MNNDQKIDAILNECHEMRVKLEVSIAYQKVQEKRLNDQQAKIEILEASRNMAIGKQSILSLIAGAVGAGIIALIKVFTGHG